MLKKIAIGLAALTISGSIIALAQTFAPNMPIINGPSYCASTTNNVCTSTIPAGPGFTGNEFVPADTGTTIASGFQSGKISVPSLNNIYNVLVGSDFGQNLWQRGTTPINAATLVGQVLMSADGWYYYQTAGAPGAQITFSKQTGVSDQPPGSAASMRIARVASQTATQQVCTGQLVPDDSTPPFTADSSTLTSPAPTGVRTAVFSVDMLAGGNWSPAGVNMIIAYHTATDVTSGAANGQGTNTATFASSDLTTQNITNYTEAVRTLMPITTTWSRYSVAAQIPLYVPGTTTEILGVGVKLCFTPIGTAGTNDWVEIGNAQLEYRGGTSTAPSGYKRHLLSDEWQLQQSRYFQISENSSGTVMYCPGQATTTNGFNVICKFPTYMRIVPVTTPITIGGFRINAAGTLQTPSVLNVTGLSNNQNAGGLSGTGTITAGQGTTLVGSGAGTGVLGWSAEP